MSLTAPAPNLFKQIVTPGMVERAMAAAVELWIDTYLGQIERIEGYDPGQIERPRGVITRSEFDKWPEEQIPLIVVMTSGLAGKPERHAQGNYHASWAVGVASIVSDIDQENTRQLSLAYAAAVRSLVLQHKMLKSATWPDGFANGTSWEDETYSDMPSLKERSISAARVIFSVGVDDVVTEYAGPREPLSPAAVDPGNWPEGVFDTTTTPIGIEDTLP